ncbi:YdgH/BhsA/McbA-like domain containing protein [Zophobihabitans entericus]|uniref:DUF1471 domain-containing protein n=1 Tax=Zophobihabitans entericus TaxID=1635327 RepID=A0A6G9IE48_9GAMM|nr:YdgH/BhsA/McbA-like domain containing protein [Zophobihabitans entericus]QIQ22092.1 DUF1471 domain-containing protein [Zophobihabitans entericus]
MTSLKKTFLAAALFTLLPVSFSSFAAEELTPERAEALTSFKEVTSRGTYMSFSDAARAISKIADKEGAAYFYITSMNTHSSNPSLRIVYANLYKADAVAKEEEKPKLRQFRGVYEYPKTIAVGFEPYDWVRLRAYYPNQYDINEAVGKAAAAKGAYAFYIDRQIETNSRNTEVTAYLFKEDAPIRHVQPENAIPYDSEAGRQALAEGGEAALQVEKPGYYSSTAFNEQYYAEKFEGTKSGSQSATTEQVKPTATAETTAVNTAGVTTQTPSTATSSSILPPTRSRYTVTLPNGTKVEELNDATAAKMVPFDSISFRGYFATDTDISYQAAKRAAEMGAKYYHITRVAENSRGVNRTVYIDLFR